MCETMRGGERFMSLPTYQSVEGVGEGWETMFLIWSCCPTYCVCVCVCVCAQGNGRLDVRGCEKRIGYCLSVFSVASSSLLFV